jgi:UDP-GlcNAc:undecaprenyl-phosphate GlcNAc-1-phosphate transferase
MESRLAGLAGYGRVARGHDQRLQPARRHRRFGGGHRGDGGHPAEATLLAGVVGSALGFLVYNFAPASIFLGDCGSLLFGFILAATAIAGWQKGATALAAGVPLLIFALPIVDSGATLIRRGFTRRHAGPVSIRSVLRQLAEPDREHIHHRLVGLGWSTRRTVVILYAVTGVLSMLALATARVNTP